MQLGRATHGGGRSRDGDSGLFTKDLFRSYPILLLKIRGDRFGSVQVGSGTKSERLSQVGKFTNLLIP